MDCRTVGNGPWERGVQLVMWSSATVACLIVALAVSAQVTPVRPQFTANQVGPTVGWLWPGRMFSIYGKNLGPVDSCVRNAGRFSPDGPNSSEEMEQVERALPAGLCGVEVLINEEPVPLIYVQADQINFVVPGSRAFGSKVVLQVVHAGVRSIPVSLKFGPDQMWLYQERVTSTGLPVWVRLYNVSEGKLPAEIPFAVFMFGGSATCPHIEVQYNGMPVPELRMKNPFQRIRYSGPVCPSPQVPDRQSLAGRIPLHLRFRMDQAGIYLARYVSGQPSIWLSTNNCGDTVDAGRTESWKRRTAAEVAA